MTMTLKETRRSRGLVSSESPSASREYIVLGTEQNPDVVEAFILANTPASVSSLVRRSITLQPRDDSATTWDVSVGYAKATKREPPEINSEEITFDISAQTIKRSQSRGTVAKYPSNAPDFGGGVGWNGKGFDGADVFVEAFSFGITKYVPTSLVLQTNYVKQLRDAAFKTNNAPFRGFEAEEILFVGAAGSPRSTEDYTVSFKFLAAKNVSGESLGLGFGGITKKAWEYLWVLYEDNQSQGFITQQPKSAYVEEFYGTTDFVANLGITA